MPLIKLTKQYQLKVRFLANSGAFDQITWSLIDCVIWSKAPEYELNSYGKQ